MDKKISEMTEKDILRQQLKLLAEESQNCTTDKLIELSMAMAFIGNVITEFPHECHPIRKQCHRLIE